MTILKVMNAWNLLYLNFDQMLVILVCSTKKKKIHRNNKRVIEYKSTEDT